MKIEVNRKLREKYKNKSIINTLLLLSKTSDTLRNSIISELEVPLSTDSQSSSPGDGTDTNSSHTTTTTAISGDKIPEDLDLQLFSLDQKLYNSSDGIDFGHNHHIINNYHKNTEEYDRSLPLIARQIAVNEMNDSEVNILKELYEATVVLRHPSLDTVKEITDFEELKTATTSKFEYEIRNLIKMCKQLNAFHGICEEDKISLLKYRCFEVILLRTITIFDFQSNDFKMFADESTSIVFKIDLIKHTKRGLYSELNEYLRFIGPEWDSDPIILETLMVISLFNPNCPNLIHREVVKFQQQLYMRLLHRYLRHRYRTESDRKYMKLMNTVTFANTLGHKQRGNVTDRGLGSCGQLIAEILDLKA
ncbi:unnamed protein product [Medioppia subpectinata]|uniref:NR LBD domain-containing protein n=1 Tax=Medioppia subpectinata TaxID=1979941 RepID=A0A7R9Q4M7_9ACAR|nr:unnamed protein product [Medioppia subpectinata]CAG2111558.1 unnamed protein product [Medioppia subpectinata]